MLCAVLSLLNAGWAIDSLVYLGGEASSGSQRQRKHHERRQADATLVLRGGTNTHAHGHKNNASRGIPYYSLKGKLHWLSQAKSSRIYRPTQHVRTCVDQLHCVFKALKRHSSHWLTPKKRILVPQRYIFAHFFMKQIPLQPWIGMYVYLPPLPHLWCGELIDPCQHSAPPGLGTGLSYESNLNLHHASCNTGVIQLRLPKRWCIKMVMYLLSITFYNC